MAKRKNQVRKPAMDELAEALTLWCQTGKRLRDKIWRVRDVNSEAMDARRCVKLALFRLRLDEPENIGDGRQLLDILYNALDAEPMEEDMDDG